MRIVADENIPLVREFFGDIGEIVALPGRQLRPDQVRDADILLVRSVTQVNEALLANSRVRFVGTATIGSDHVDAHYLATSGIGFANAPGCNATSVVEYVISVFTVLAERFGFDWRRKRVGIVGLGNVGGRLRTTLEALGLDVCASDPPLAEQGHVGLVPLEQVLACDLISLHTPLTKSGPHPTFHLLNEYNFDLIRPHQVLINTGRGPVIDEIALLRKLRRSPDWPVVLDVWEHEPEVNAELLQRVQLGTAHIAGYSLDGKMRGTEMVYREVCRYLSLPIRHRLQDFLPKSPLAEIRFNGTMDSGVGLDTAIRACYDPRKDDALLRLALRDPSRDPRTAFDQLRRNYSVRREFCNTTVGLDSNCHSLNNELLAVGFRTRITDSRS